MASINKSDKRKDMEAIIINGKFDGLSYMDISKMIEVDIGVKVSHVTVSKHWRDYMHGDLLQERIDQLQLGVVSEGEPIEVDPIEINAAKSERGFYSAMIRARALYAGALIQNAKSVSDGTKTVRRDISAAIKDIQSTLTTSVKVLDAKKIESAGYDESKQYCMACTLIGFAINSYYMFYDRSHEHPFTLVGATKLELMPVLQKMQEVLNVVDTEFNVYSAKVRDYNATDMERFEGAIKSESIYKVDFELDTKAFALRFEDWLNHKAESSDSQDEEE